LTTLFPAVDCFGEVWHNPANSVFRGLRVAIKTGEQETPRFENYLQKAKMEKVKRSCLMVIVFLGAGISALLISSGTAPAETKFHYTKEECVKCHAARVKEIATAGKRHRNVPCIGCHPGHPPEVKKPIEPCSKCHQKTRKAHFELTGCLNCHKNPHTPLNITFEGKDACLNCHLMQSELLRDNVSKHSLLDCSTCHRVHRMVPQCTQCHKPHSAENVTRRTRRRS
jgi:hypothetical protein